MPTGPGETGGSGGVGLLGVHHAAAICSDYERSKAFYVDVLGLGVVAETWRPESGSWKLDLALARGGASNTGGDSVPGAPYDLELFWFGARPARPDRPEALGLRHLAFSVASVEESRGALLVRGVEVEPVRVDPVTGRRFAFFKDPDGLPLELYEAAGDSYAIRHARPSDISAIMELEARGFHGGIREEESVFRARLAAFPAGFVVLERDGRVLGYLCAERWAEQAPLRPESFALGHDPGPRYAANGRVLYLASITVDPALRGTGLGRRLFVDGSALVRAACPEVALELLVVNEEWLGARHIYEQAGFSEVGRLPGFFPSAPGGAPGAASTAGAGSDGLVMERRIPG